jgi:hypothetical protein
MAVSRSVAAAETRTMLLVAAPLAAANLAQMAMQVTNAVMVGHLGAVSLPPPPHEEDCQTDRRDGYLSAATVR